MLEPKLTCMFIHVVVGLDVSVPLCLSTLSSSVVSVACEPKYDGHPQYLREIMAHDHPMHRKDSVGM